MSTENPSLAPKSRCPLCGGPNQCAMVAGRPPESCWCMTQSIGPTALAAVSEAQRGQVCICAACGAAYSSGQRPFANGAPPAPI